MLRMASASNLVLSLSEPPSSHSDERPNWALAPDSDQTEDVVKPKPRRRSKFPQRSSSGRDTQTNRARISSSVQSPSRVFAAAESSPRAPAMNCSHSRSQESEYTSKFDYGLHFHYKNDSPGASMPYTQPLVDRGQSVDPDSPLSWRSISLKKPLPAKPISSHHSQPYTGPSSSETASHNQPTTYALLPSTQSSTSIWATDFETPAPNSFHTDLAPDPPRLSLDSRSEINHGIYRGMEWHDSGGIISLSHPNRSIGRDDRGSFHAEGNVGWSPGSFPTSAHYGNHSASRRRTRQKSHQGHGDISNLALSPEEVLKKRRIDVNETSNSDGNDGYHYDSDEWKGKLSRSASGSAYGTPSKRSKWKKPRGGRRSAGRDVTTDTRQQPDQGTGGGERPSSRTTGLATPAHDSTRQSFPDEGRAGKSQSEPDLIDFTSEVCVEPVSSAAATTAGVSQPAQTL